MPSKAVREVYRVLIEAVYRRWNVEKIGDVPQIMEKYKGQEDEIYDKVVRKYVFCHKENVWRPLIEAMYRRFNKAKLQELPQILSKYKKSEAALYRALCDKYIPGIRKGDPPPDVDVWPEVSESASPISAKSAEPEVAIASPVSAKSAEPETDPQVAEQVTAEPPANAEPEAEPASAPTATSATTTERPADTLESEYPVVADAPLLEEAEEDPAEEAGLALVSEEEQESADAPSAAVAAETDAALTAAETGAAAAPAEEAEQQVESSSLPAEPGSAPGAETASQAEEAPQSAASAARRHHRPRRREAAQEETPADREARRAARREARAQRAGAAAGQPAAEAGDEAQDAAGEQNGFSELHQLPAKRALDEAESAAAGHRQRSRRRRAEAEGTMQEAVPHAQSSGAGDQVAPEAPAGPVQAAVETKLDREARRAARREAKAQQLAAAGQQPPQAGLDGQQLTAELQPDENGKRTAPSDLHQPRRKRRRVQVGAALEGQQPRSRRRRAEVAATEQPAVESSAGDPPAVPERPLATRPKASRRPPQRLSPGGSAAMAQTPPAAEQPTQVTGASTVEQKPPKSEWEKAWEAKQGQAQAPEAASSSSAAVPGVAQAAAPEQSAEEAQAAMRRREAALREILHQKRLRAGTALVSVTPTKPSRETPQSELQVHAQAAPAVASNASAPQPTSVTTVHVRKSKRHHAKKEGTTRSHRQVTLAPGGTDAAEPPKVTLRTGIEASIRAKALKMFGIHK
mmetsp:Transcript_73667/g.140147  ORF Transcript_73667/g.140147 Transcript_73667/m.140147 type:complete len:748 (-) Transcript_73667:74-2317(-)